MVRRHSSLGPLRKQRPYDYLKLVASLLPQAFSVSVAQAPPPMTEDEFASLKYRAPSLPNTTKTRPARKGLGRGLFNAQP